MNAQICANGARVGGQEAHTLSAKHCYGSRGMFATGRVAAQPRRLQSLQVQNAISRQKKEEIVADLVEKLDSSAVVLGYHHKGINVKTMTELRRALPQEAKVVVAKNTLMRLAVEKTQGWDDFKPTLEYDNAWIFVPEDVIASTVKAFLEMEKKLDEKMPPEKRKKHEALPLTGAMMNGSAGLLTWKDLDKLKKAPTKLELIATIARLIKQVPTRVAVSIKQVPTKMAYAVKALADGDDNKEAKIGDIFPKAEAEATA